MFAAGPVSRSRAVIKRYWRGEERYLPSTGALPSRAQAGVHRGRIQGLDATWYQRDDEEPVLAATAVADHAAAPASGGQWPPEFARALGAAWHAYQKDGPAADHRQVFEEEFDGDHLKTWKALAKHDPQVTPPDEVPESEWWDNEPKRKVRFYADQYVMSASPTYGGWELSTNVQPVARELLFATTVDGVAIGGQVDRVVTSHGDELPAGIYAVETKLAGTIRREHILQTEAYRRVFWPELEPINAVIVRVDPIALKLPTRCGLRRKEVTRVTPSDLVTDENGDHHVRVWEAVAKHDHYREPPVPDELATEMRTMVDLAGLDDDDSLVSVTDKTVYRWLMSIIDELRNETGNVGWEHVDVQDLRRSWATHILGEGVLPSVVMSWGCWHDWHTFRRHYLAAFSPKVLARERQKVDFLTDGDPLEADAASTSAMPSSSSGSYSDD